MPTSRDALSAPHDSPPEDATLRLARGGAALLISAAVLFAVCVASLALGAKSIPMGDVVAALFGRGEESVRVIIGDWRLSRTVVGLVCGVALGAAGVVIGALTRNPIADPGLLGVNAGAALGVVVGLTVSGGMGVTGYTWFAFAGAGVAAVLVYLLSMIGRSTASPLRLALSGVALAAVLSGVTQLLVFVDESVLDSYRFWRIGSLAARDLDDTLPLIPYVLGAALLALALCRAFNALSLGDRTAAALGVNLGLIRFLGFVVVTVLCGAATALAGPIAFVGLLVVHIAQYLVGSDYRLLVPLSMLLAPTLLLGADVLGRVIADGGPVPVGVMTAFVGCPALIALIVWSTRMGAGS
ncbi:FecCD family ABC transporter permease [Nocardia puris]|uniref:Iron complex transport system permease protein n=1 Tax=Nocardia puris TaxID=208602 RepID=A0A366DHW4_9NOCA|nr:iron chelate uptake ABC transporter family permease subunit [Nocardia puris]RBO89611.1 iron complex transport system permease protein [Nocardia puris]